MSIRLRTRVCFQIRSRVSFPVERSKDTKPLFRDRERERERERGSERDRLVEKERELRKREEARSRGEFCNFKLHFGST